MIRIAAAALAAFVAIPGVSIKEKTASADAGVQVRAPDIKTRRLQLTTSAKALAAIITENTKVDCSLKKIYWATEKQNESQDMAVATFSEGSGEFVLVFVFLRGEWQVLPETLR